MAATRTGDYRSELLSLRAVSSSDISLRERDATFLVEGFSLRVFQVGQVGFFGSFCPQVDSKIVL